MPEQDTSEKQNILASSHKKINLLAKLCRCLKEAAKPICAQIKSSKKSVKRMFGTCRQDKKVKPNASNTTPSTNVEVAASNTMQPLITSPCQVEKCKTQGGFFDVVRQVPVSHCVSGFSSSCSSTTDTVQEKNDSLSQQEIASSSPASFSEKKNEAFMAWVASHMEGVCCANDSPDCKSYPDGNYVIVRANGPAFFGLPKASNDCIIAQGPSPVDVQQPDSISSVAESDEEPDERCTFCYQDAHALLKAACPSLTDEQAAAVLNGTCLDVITGRKEIGHGGFATVYEVYIQECGGFVAVKTMDIWGSTDFEHFIHEASCMITAAELGGRGTIPLLRIVFTPGVEGTDTVIGHLVMGRAWGSLSQEVARVMKQAESCAAENRSNGMCPLSVSLEGLSLQLKECILMMECGLDLSQQLDGLKTQRKIHGDIKPENVLLGRNLRTGKRFATFSDWGGTIRLPDGMDSVGVDVGTPCCQAPESLCCYSADQDNSTSEDIGSLASTPSDIYSFGVLQARVMFLFIDVLSVLCPEIVDAIVRCLAYDPHERPTAVELCAVFERCLIELRLAEAEELQTMRYVLDCVNAPASCQPRTMHLMRHLLKFVLQRQELGVNVKEADFVRDADTATLWLAADAVGCADQLGDYVWSMACGQLGVKKATVWLEGWDEDLAHEQRVMAALRVQMLCEGMHSDWTMQRAKDVFPVAFAAAYRQTQIAFGAMLV